jgi:hypothetical protein
VVQQRDLLQGVEQRTWGQDFDFKFYSLNK